MLWFWLGIIANVLWSAGNFIDKVLTERFVHGEGRALVLTLYTSLLSLALLPILYGLFPHVLSISLQNAFIVAGGIEMVAIILYLKALIDEDASTVVPFFQVVPVFSLFLGFWFLGETLSPLQVLAGLGVVAGGAILSLEISEEKHVRFKHSLVMLMLISAFLYALFEALFKVGAIEVGFWAGVFWQQVGIVCVGILIAILRPGCARAFINNIKERGKIVFGLNIFNEMLYVGGMMLFAYALLLAPIAVVSTTNAYHPVFVFILGIILSVVFPKLIKENTSWFNLLHKTLAITIVVVSSIYLVMG